MQDYPMPVKQPVENYKLLRQDLKAFLKDIKKTTAPPGGGGGTGTAIYGLYRYVPV